MSSGKTHDSTGTLFIWLYLVVYMIGIYLYNPSIAIICYGVCVALGLFTGIFFLSPDLDLRQSKPSKRWGLLRFLWLPYNKLFKHRGISHWPIVGTLTRQVYIMLFVGPVLYYYVDINICMQYIWYYLAFVGGCAVTDLVHITMDL